MELLYLWINRSDHNCIKQQEFNFSPLYKFKVDDLKNPRNLSCEKKNTINLFNSSVDNGKINNITAVVGSNGAGKTTILSFIANNNCFSKFNSGLGYERNDANEYEHHKSIYVFNENEKLIIYYNLEEKLTCNFDVLHKNVYWNKENKIEQLCNVRKQLIIYLSNNSFVPELLLGYSKSDKTYNINLHQRSMYLVANNFYKAIFSKTSFDDIRENDDGFAWVIKENRDDRKFQELLDIQYYQYLSENKISDFAGNFKCEINIYFENIINLIESKYHDDFEILKASNEGCYNLSRQKPDKAPSESSKKYFDKIADFKNHYKFKEIEDVRRKNSTVVLYVNLLFDMFFNEENFELSTIDFNISLYEQLKKLPLSEKYKAYLEDIKKIDDILYSCPMNKNIIENPDDLACSYEKVIYKKNADFYKHIRNIFKERKSFALRYIRVKNLEMSSGERAMQNMFSWLVLMPELDEIMGMERSNYTSKLLLIDEIDLYAHPEWQRKIMSQLISTINKIEKEKPVQIVVSSHSPLILSDFPRQNIIYMNKSEGKTVVVNSDNHKQSFGANIYTLLKEAFFLENGAVGEFAKKKIYEVYEELKSKEHSDNYVGSNQNENQLIINMIGDEFVRNEIQRSFDKKYGKVPQPIIKEIPQNINELQRLKKQLENSLDAVNKMLGGG
jgi:predicted ATP-binding protein involved in virulence